MSPESCHGCLFAVSKGSAVCPSVGRIRRAVVFNPFTEVAGRDGTDAELVEQAKNGDLTALEKLVLRHQAWIYNTAVRMVCQPHDAEEVTQEVLVKVITKLSTFKGESKFLTWLYRIA